jgi:hypothetical protein
MRAGKYKDAYIPAALPPRGYIGSSFLISQLDIEVGVIAIENISREQCMT